MDKKMYFRDRIQAVKDKGYLHGINELRFPTDIELYRIMTTKLSEITPAKQEA